MRKTLYAGAMVLILGLAYLAWPFASAWQLRQAVKAGDLPVIEAHVEWAPVRASLKASIQASAGLMAEFAEPDLGDQPSLWQRIKRTLAPSLIDQAVDQMITPQGLTRLFAARESYRHRLRPAIGLTKPKRALDGTWFEGGRIAKFADSFERIKRVVFTSLTRVEIQVADRYRPERHYITVLQLKDFRWKLVGLRLLPAPA